MKKPIFVWIFSEFICLEIWALDWVTQRRTTQQLHHRLVRARWANPVVIIYIRTCCLTFLGSRHCTCHPLTQPAGLASEVKAACSFMVMLQVPGWREGSAHIHIYYIFREIFGRPKLCAMFSGQPDNKEPKIEFLFKYEKNGSTISYHCPHRIET